MAYVKKVKKTAGPASASDAFMRALIKDDPIASVMVDGVASAEFTGWMDTGSYILNALLSGSLYGGVANNKPTGFAGEASTGKTFFIIGALKSFLDSNPRAIVVYYDTEAAVTKKMMQERGIDVSRVIIVEPETIEVFRTHATKILNAYMEQDESDRPPMAMVLDSLGMLPSNKELEDITAGENKRDMTKQQGIRATFRVLTLKLAKAKVPLLLTQHTYEVVGAYVPTKELSGGGGFKYAASTIATLSKSKERDADKNVVGNVITVTMYKSRLSKENAKAKVLLTYDKGLDRYYGLLPLAEKYGIIERAGKKWRFPNGTELFESKIAPSDWDPLLDQLELAANKEFSYGHSSATVIDEETGEVLAE